MSQDRALQLREATPADLATLAGFACAMARETEARVLDRATVERGIAAVLDDPSRGRYLVAERGGEAVGTLMLTYEWSDWRAATWWWIQSVYVSPAARRQGVFRALYRHVEQAAAADPGVCGLRLYVERDNRDAQSTYAALGMRESHYRLFERALP